MNNEDVRHSEVECLFCGKKFVQKRINKVYCCKECSTNASKIRRGIAPTITHKKICKGCGKEFETRYYRKEYCCKHCGDNKRGYKKITPKTNPRPRISSPKPKRIIVYEMRECIECGELFIIDEAKGNKYCSSECKKKHYNRKRDKRIPKSQIVDNDISLKRLFKRDNGKCWICGGMCDFNSFDISKKGNKICGDLYPEIEHVIPISRGGLHSWNNVRLAHHKCNAIKGADLYPYVPLDVEFAYKEKAKGNPPKKTAQYTLDGTLIKIWDSTAQIKRELGLNDRRIQSVCRKDRSKTGNAFGYHWEYVND